MGECANGRSIEPRQWLSCRRSVFCYVLLAGCVLTVALFLGSRSPVQATPNARTDEEVLHLKLVIDVNRRALAEAINLASRYGRVIHLDQAVAAARMVLPVTLATDPYTLMEIAHLNNAILALGEYSQARGHSQDRGNSAPYPHARKALKDLDRIFDSIQRDRGMR